MVLSDLTFAKEKVQEICDILEIPYFELNGDIALGSTERNLLNNEDLNELTEKFCFIGVDGTTTRISDDAESPTQVSISDVVWGIQNMRTHTIKYDQRIVYEARELLDKSSVRTILEVKSVICLMLARKFKRYNCKDCPINKQGCQWQENKPMVWEEFPEKVAVGILDLPVIFAFIKALPQLDKKNREFLLSNLQKCFDDIKNHELPVIFVSQRSTLKVVSDDLISELDNAINSIDTRAKALIDLIRNISKDKTIKLPALVELRNKMEEKFFTDYDLLEDWLGDIARPTPVFNVKPAEYNNNWDGLKFHYLSWGYKELINGSWVYFPSTWVRVGYSPALSPSTAHKIICLEMMLGKGHSVSLTLAHISCNLYKKHGSKLLLEFYNKTRPDKYKLGRNVKDINKWRLMKNG